MSFDFQKASQSFDSLPYQDRFKAVGQLIKNTFTIIGRDKDIVKPWIRMAIYHLVMVTAFFYGVLGWWYELPGEFAGVLLAVVLFIYKHFYQNKQEVRLSWIVYQTIIGNDPSYKGAVRECKQIQDNTRKLAWLDIGMAIVSTGRRSGSGFLVFLINMFISGLEEVWDLVNHYLLPSVAIDQLDISSGVTKMKKLKDQVPETLVGVFGIDFIGNVVGQVTGPFYVVLIIISGLLGYVGVDYFPAMEIPFNDTTLTVSLVPVVIAIYFGKLFSNLFERTVTCIKVIYFTVFYTKITHPGRITEELQEELLDYLKLEHVQQVENLEEQESPDRGMQPATS